ncbi:MAG: hypothetical protein HeimC2_16010 [Candidatus Heimdallarchaeota archaeon LC_2]|nr:MAG: hypothetical protein HeimC2_16010 [Candidatus Heimdallarchaeota archaeon LC_2]
MEEFDPLDDLDSLFENEESYVNLSQQNNILIIGSRGKFHTIKKVLSNSLEKYNIFQKDTLDEAIVLLLQELFAIVVIDNDREDINAVSVSRVVRINHPLARVVVISKKRGSRLIANIINHGSVDAFLSYPLKENYVSNLFAEQLAKHEITKMLSSFVSQPPKLSKASYLLLDPTLTFADETQPVKFVGVMIIWKSVPRYTKFFEDILAKDEILFAGYLSGVSMLGRELLATKDPLREINFGGVSVILRFHDDLQVSIFIRNLTRHNFENAEIIITDMIDEIIRDNLKDIAQFDLIKDDAYNNIVAITGKLEASNQIEKIEPEIKTEVSDNNEVLLFGIDKASQDRLVKYFAKKSDIQITNTTNHSDAIKFLNSHHCGVLLLDSNLPEDAGDPLFFAEHAKEINPSIQVVFRARDRRASSPLIFALNSGFVNFLIPYKLSRKQTLEWSKKAMEKSLEISMQSKSGESIDQALDQAAIARTMIRGNVKQYDVDDIPELHGIFIFRDVTPIFQVFWEYQNSKIEFDEEMMAGLVSSLDAVGGEMFVEAESIGALELGGAKIIVQHSEDIKIAFFVKHVDPNTSVVINKFVSEVAIQIFKIIADENRQIDSYKIRARFDTLCNRMRSEFNEKFSI